jgi:hypothetical protein
MEETSDGSPNSKDSGGPAEPSYILPGMSGLSRSQKKIIEAKVRAIKSEVPIYIAIMRKTNAAVSKLVSSMLLQMLKLLLYIFVLQIVVFYHVLVNMFLV